MNYDIKLADRVREYLSGFPKLNIDEKKMFGGVAFMVNDKMCVCVSGERLMCRFDPALEEEVAEKNGFEPMVMKGKQLKGYGYINPLAVQSNSQLTYWIDLCLSYNERAKSSKKLRSKR